jgi:SAM domain (Sterile alpha motif)
MSEYMINKNFQEWTAHELAQYIKSKSGLEGYGEMFENQNINGKVATRLTESDFKEMGVSKIGDRHSLKAAIETLAKAKSAQDREKVIWEGTEVMYFSCWDSCCTTCCGCCPQIPATYKLMYNHLEIKQEDPCLCGPCRCCCGHAYKIDNIDLSNVSDTDVEGVPPPCFQECCCGGQTMEHVHVRTTNEGDKILKCPKGTGQDVARKIKNQVEAMQMMERS